MKRDSFKADPLVANECNVIAAREDDNNNCGLRELAATHMERPERQVVEAEYKEVDAQRDARLSLYQGMEPRGVDRLPRIVRRSSTS